MEKGVWILFARGTRSAPQTCTMPRKGKVEDYQFSTVREFVGADTPSKFLHPIDGLDVKSAKGAGKGILNWLNSPLRKEQEEMIRKAIRKREFSFSNASRFRKEIEAIPKSPW